MHVEISEGIRSILIVEDEGLIALMMEDIARSMGVEEVHCCADLASAIDLARTADIDCAVLDRHVRDGETMEIADILAERDVPFVFLTGSGAEALDARHRHRPILSKPFADDDFRLVVLDALALARSQRSPVISATA